MATKYPAIGSVIERRDKETGKQILDGNGMPTYYIKVDKNVDLQINGTKVTGYLNVSYPRDKADRMLEKGTITKSEHKEKVSRFVEGGDLDYIVFEIGAKIEE